MDSTTTKENGTALTKKDGPVWSSRPFLEAFRRGDRAGLIGETLRARGLTGLKVAEVAVNSPHITAMAAALEDLATFALEVRRQNVAVIGSHDVFVRRTTHGDLQQVIAPVRLSLADDTLYQMPVFAKYQKGTDIIEEDRDRDGDWKSVVPAHAKHKATITAFGLNHVNKVAGCAIGQPDSVVVDGVERTNPYVERWGAPNGRPGDIVRVVVRVNVVGPAPATGNPVIVQYTLDLDPSKDLQHLLMGGLKDNAADILLIDEDEWEKFKAERQGGRWKLLPLYAGVGIAHNLANKNVAKFYTKYVNLLQNALKKAQTVARRNAMRAHPALAFQTVAIDAAGVAVVPVTGWASSERNMAQYAQMLDRMARGLQPDLAAEMIEVADVYDPEVDAVGSASVDATVEETTPTPTVDQAVAALVAQIDAGLRLLSPDQVASLHYDPTATEAELRVVLGEMNRMLDADQTGPRGAK